VIDKYAGASHLIKEMNLVGERNTLKSENIQNRDKIETINELIEKNPEKADLYYKMLYS
jgi:hypothetical protein